jgi:hypothetical protein
MFVRRRMHLQIRYAASRSVSARQWWKKRCADWQAEPT